MFSSLLIANRGEIACRIIRTARRMGLRTVAVYSDADAGALHVRLADAAVRVGPAAARASYLDIRAIVAAAQQTSAEAVHPGYGFLSENADFAEACERAGLVFVGPPVAAIRAMGSKAESKALMQAAGVPVVPGYHGAAQDPATLAREAARVGYPVLIKASAGGGGRGMRVVAEAAALAAAAEGAAREAEASFGDGRLLIEKYLARPRHIEIQVFADAHGQAVSLFERDCSIQRRHQKVVEEAPAPGMTEVRRAAMGEAAVAAARAVGYRGAGTVEFIAEGEDFYFMEMNTRLQVEHPVTEMVTGLDLVEWQLRVAAGEALPAAPAAPRGHAIEVRLYAEDPARDFLPSTGTLLHLRFPETEGGDVRVDSGVRAGDRVTPFYDPMLAKLIVRGDTRGAAVRRLRAALGATEVAGVATNLGLLRAIAAAPDFAAGAVDTGFIGRHPDLLGEPGGAPPDGAWIAAALVVLAGERAPADPGDPFSPWDAGDAWRVNGTGYQDVWLRAGAAAPEAVRLFPGDADGRVTWRGAARQARLAEDVLTLDGHARRCVVRRAGDEIAVVLDGVTHVLARHDTRAAPGAEAAGGDRVTAPIPGRVTRVLAAAGERVRRGAALMVLEAMKMELTLTAPRDGTIGAVRAAEGDMVTEGTELVSFADDAA